jgi:2-acylglycerol O-acyltransferase 2
MLHGVASVSKPSCANILSRGPGTAITIVIGGAAESLSAHPGTADLTLKKRFGFIKMAIREGADLVPVFSFGENDVSIGHPSVLGERLLIYRYTTNCEMNKDLVELTEQGQQQRLNAVQGAEEFPKSLWLYIAAVLRSRASLRLLAPISLINSIFNCMPD